MTPARPSALTPKRAPGGCAESAAKRCSPSAFQRSTPGAMAANVARYGNPSAAPRPSRASAVEHRALLQDEPTLVAHYQAQVELVEAPALAAGSSSHRPGIGEEERAALREHHVRRLVQARAWRRDEVIGHVLEPRPLAHPRREAVHGGRAAAPVHPRRRRRGEADMGASADRHPRLEHVAPEEAARRIQQHEGGGAAAVEVHGLERLQRQREAALGQDRAPAAPLEGQIERAVAPHARERPIRTRRAARAGSSRRRCRRRSRPGDW